MAIEPKPLSTSSRPSRYNLTYAFELVALDGSGGFGQSGGGANRVVNLPINPTNYNVNAQAAAAITPTGGGVAVEEDGFILRECTVAGTTGLKTRRAWSAGTIASPGGLVEVDGVTAWRELRNLFDLYSRFRQEPEKAPARYVMAWHDFRLDDHWIVVPKSFEMSRDLSYRLHLPYSISFTAVADYDKLTKNFFDDGIFGDIKSAAAKVRAAIAVVTGGLEDMKAFVQGVDAVISGAILGTIAAVSELVAAAQGVKDAVADFISLPQRVAQAIRDLVDQLHQLIGARSAWSPLSDKESTVLAVLETTAVMAEAIDSMLANRDIWRPSWSGIAQARSDLAAGERRLTRREIEAAARAGTAPGEMPASDPLSLTARATAGSSDRLEGIAAAPRGTPRYTGQRAYTVRDGDTLLGIAVREMGDPDAWVDIRDANELRPPYISTIRLPGTVTYGGILMLPTTGAQQDTIPSKGPALDEAADEALLGIDFALSSEGEWVIDPASGGTDVLEVRGVACYEADLDCRFRTPLGTNLIAPGVGILAPIGQQNGVGVPQAVALSVRSAALQDPRTESVEGLNVRDEGDTVAVELTAFPRGSQGGRVLRRVLE